MSDNCALVLGVAPDNQFNVIGRLEAGENRPLILHHEDLLNFINCVEEQFEVNAIYPVDIQRQVDVTHENFIKIVSLQQVLGIYKIKFGGNSIKIEEEVLQKLFIQIPMVKYFIKSLESDRAKYESYLLKLLNHFCFGKNVYEAKKLSETIYTQHFFEECIHFHCDCIDKQFIGEIAINFAGWFVKCIIPFIQTVMVSEQNRLNSFSHGWVHDKSFIDIEIMARSGLYYTGDRDCVECPFCNIKLNTWENTDDPIENHNNYSPYCPLLVNPRNTDNIPINGNVKKLMKMLQALSRIGYDEVDI